MSGDAAPPEGRAPRARSSKGLALVGYRGTGKSTVGRLLADRLGLPFLDADRELEARTGRPIAALFASGEPAFRDLEERLLRDLTADPRRAVLATGGGAVIREANRQALRAWGFVAWLTADPDELATRLRDDPADRPALTAAGPLAEIAAVLAARAPLYRAVADATIATDRRTAQEVAAAVLDAWSGESS